ncbi:caax prenyl protease [Nesidiocoris tenuis]|uniref:CAAX prenyl protease 2 n=1 Tax=Nesidiocoris tenuis TaxID=355587 RepID=A0ABN7AQ67_9HEMI|nr:caax prenyl protease [Nesidiocoris tenuis]
MPSCSWPVAVAECLTLSVAYVCSLYVWPSTSSLNRDHPETIKRRVVSATVMAVLSPIFTYFVVGDDLLENRSIWQLLGLRTSGLLSASTIPLMLTVFLFLGPIVVKLQNFETSVVLDRSYWTDNLTSIYWLRDHVVAPLSEELTFRASMLPLLVGCASPSTAVFVAPLFFGVAHLHHVFGLVSSGVPLRNAALYSAFQLSYTTLFGAYSAFLFLRTGHFVSPFFAHAFCNFMGFPDFADVLSYDEPKRSFTLLAFLVGLVSWCCLLVPLTNPLLYDNTLYWDSNCSAAS